MTTLERIESAKLKRRQLLKVLGAAGVATMLPSFARSQGKEEPEGGQFVFTRIRYDKGDWMTDTLAEGLQNGAEVHLLAKIQKELGFNAYTHENIVRPHEDKIFDHPFLYITGHNDIEMSDIARSNIRTIIEHGGFLLADNCSGAKDIGFDRAIRGQLRMMFPDKSLTVLPKDHPVFSSYYKVDQVLGGDKRLDPFLEGMDFDGRTSIVYTRNDLGCAWEGHPCSPGGEKQRSHAFEMGINIIFYALSGV